MFGSMNLKICSALFFVLSICSIIGKSQSNELKDFKYAIIINNELNADSVYNSLVYWHQPPASFEEFQEVVIEDPSKWKRFPDTKIALDYLHDHGYKMHSFESTKSRFGGSTLGV